MAEFDNDEEAFEVKGTAVGVFEKDEEKTDLGFEIVSIGCVVKCAGSWKISKAL